MSASVVFSPPIAHLCFCLLLSSNACVCLYLSLSFLSACLSVFFCSSITTSIVSAFLCLPLPSPVRLYACLLFPSVLCIFLSPSVLLYLPLPSLALIGLPLTLPLSFMSSLCSYYPKLENRKLMKCYFKAS